MRSATPQGLTCLLQKKAGFTYEYFHGPARSQGLAEKPSGSEDQDMAGVVKNITYGELWSNKNSVKAHGEFSLIIAATVHFDCSERLWCLSCRREDLLLASCFMYSDSQLFSSKLFACCFYMFDFRASELVDNRVRGPGALPLNIELY